jgi:hypothetical protein
MEALFKSKEEDFGLLVQNKNKFIDELKRRLMDSDKEKYQII